MPVILHVLDVQPKHLAVVEAEVDQLAVLEVLEAVVLKAVVQVVPLPVVLEHAVKVIVAVTVDRAIQVHLLVVAVVELEL
jgi:hypothetical protein